MQEDNAEVQMVKPDFGILEFWAVVANEAKTSKFCCGAGNILPQSV
jgi:hypothetical protein